MNTVIKLSSPATSQFWEIPVLYEDEHLLALDKPSDLLTSPNPRDAGRPSLTRLLHAGIAQGKPWAREHGLAYLAPTHRLDAEASGILLLAKAKPVLVALLNMFGVETPGRKFLVLVQGALAEDRFEVDAKLALNPFRAPLMHVDPRRGKRSRTVCAVQEKLGNFALLQCEALTDRPHQVRVHLRYVGLPVIGDRLYGGGPLFLSSLKRGYHLKPNQVERPLIDRPALHAAELALLHPITNEPLTITAPWPKDLSVAVKYLRRDVPA